MSFCGERHSAAARASSEKIATCASCAATEAENAREEGRGYAAEQARWGREAMRRELRDVTGADGSGYGSRGRW
jgi:hypothetical protein